jgi:hypothetical protein
MARARGSGSMGPTRSMRLPQALDEWFTERLERHSERSPSAILVQLIHGGLRLREGYMEIHRRVLEQHMDSAEPEAFAAAYIQCLTDTFGPEYVAHLKEWLAAERVARPVASSNGKSRS